MDYVPFLKLKQNEASGIDELDPEMIDAIVPVFDIARSQDMDDDDLIARIGTSVNQLERYHGHTRPLYLDVFDIDPTLRPNGAHPYEYTLTEMSDFVIYPVVGLDRDPGHIHAAENHLASNTNLRVAIRLLPPDIEHYAISHSGIDYLFKLLSQHTDSIDIIIDQRIIYGKDIDPLATTTIDFIDELNKNFEYSNLIITSCCMPSSVSEAVQTETTGNISRQETELYNSIAAKHPGAIYGDYTIVSPEFTDIPIELFNRVSAPKIIYTFDNYYYVARGGAFRTHPQRYAQYYSLANTIVSHPDWRGDTYSFGDNVVFEKSQRIGGTGSPGTWLKAMINAHITFILEDII